jgi:soluble lytic murein transglycosylase-like protein
MKSLKKIAVIPMLMLLGTGIYVGAEHAAAENNVSTKIETQHEKLNDIDSNIKAVNTQIDESISQKEQSINDLRAVRVASEHGYGQEVGITIVQQAKLYDLDPSFIMGVIETESTWRNPGANSCGAMGLMQVTQETGASLARDLGIENPDLMNPVTNIKLGTYYLACLIRRYGSYDKALTAYNRGEGGLQSYMASTGTAQSDYSITVLRNQAKYR